MPACLATALTAPQLVDVTRHYGREFRGVRRPYVAYDVDRRWHRRIYRDGHLDVWLISWLPSQGTELHDHGGSSGAFTVVSGELAETVVARARLRDRTHHEGETVGFGPHYVHDVRNLSSAPAVSVHAYSPPLTRMTYYDLIAGQLRAVASLPTDDPEPSGGLRPA